MVLAGHNSIIQLNFTGPPQLVYSITFSEWPVRFSFVALLRVLPIAISGLLYSTVRSVSIASSQVPITAHTMLSYSGACMLDVNASSKTEHLQHNSTINIDLLQTLNSLTRLRVLGSALSSDQFEFPLKTQHFTHFKVFHTSVHKNSSFC